MTSVENNPFAPYFRLWKGMEARLEKVNPKYTHETCPIDFTAECKVNLQHLQSVKEMYTTLCVCVEN